MVDALAATTGLVVYHPDLVVLFQEHRGGHWRLSPSSSAALSRDDAARPELAER
jgi:hypothetical protein